MDDAENDLTEISSYVPPISAKLIKKYRDKYGPDPMLTQQSSETAPSAGASGCASIVASPTASQRC